MTTVVEFLQQRYDEIEAAARGAARLAETECWTIPEPRDYYDGVQLRDRGHVGPVQISWNAHPEHDPREAADADHLADHISRHDPAYVLADITAKRAILDLHARNWIRPGHPEFNGEHLTKESMAVCCSCRPETQFRRERSWPCRTLRALALSFASHPDYDEAWRPSRTRLPSYSGPSAHHTVTHRYTNR